jgi:DNA-binding response OmpR family regulator
VLRINPRNNAVRVLIVEDEPGIAGFLRQGLTEAGYAVDLARDGREGLDFALAAAYDVLVLDLMLHSLDGLSMLRELRSRGRRTPTLLLTARDTVDCSGCLHRLPAAQDRSRK